MNFLFEGIAEIDLRQCAIGLFMEYMPLHNGS